MFWIDPAGIRRKKRKWAALGTTAVVALTFRYLFKVLDDFGLLENRKCVLVLWSLVMGLVLTEVVWSNWPTESDVSFKPARMLLVCTIVAALVIRLVDVVLLNRG